MKIITKISALAAIVILLSSCTKKTEVRFFDTEKAPVFSYAQNELDSFLNDQYLNDAGKAGIQTVNFTFRTDKGLPEAAFNVNSK